MKIKKLLFTLCLTVLLQNTNAQTFNIYVSDAGSFGPPNQILKYDQNGNNPEVFIDQNLNWPQDILFLEDQNVVLISNLNTNVITKYNALTGDYIEDFAQVAGGPTRMEIGSDDLIYVLQWAGNGRVLRYQQDGTFVDEFTTVGVNQSIGIDWDASGNLYVSSFAGAFVRKYSPTGSDLGLFINSNLTGPTNVKFDSNNNVLVLDWSAGDIERFDSDGNHINTFVTGVSQAEGIDFYPNGNFIIGHGADSSIKLYSANGTFIEEIIASGSGGLVRPNAVVLRDTSLSLENVESTSTDIIFENSYGHRFKINSKITGIDAVLNVYDLSGRLIETTHLNQSTYWNSNSIKNGIYIASTTINGAIITQKITVKKQ